MVCSLYHSNTNTRSETRAAEIITFRKTVEIIKICWEPLASEELLLEQSSPGCIRLFAQRSLWFSSSTWLFKPCTSTIYSQIIQKISMSHQNILHHLISEVFSVDIKGLAVLESSKRNTSKGDVPALPKLTAELKVISLRTGPHLKHWPSCGAFWKLHFNNFERLFVLEKWV